MGAKPSVPVLIPDQYKSFEELTAALRAAGVKKTQLIVGVDFTGSNLKAGTKTFGGRSLHDISDPTSPNPYEQALTVVSKALWEFDDDHRIPSYGFGDSTTKGNGVFAFQQNDVPCKGLTGCLGQYRKIVERSKLSGPTSFAPLIRQAVHIVRETNEYHILVIVADGQVSRECKQATIDSIVEASKYALSIVMVGVGDGPWAAMDQFDDNLPNRCFDNFQFVDFNSVFTRYPLEKRETAFATHALMEIPAQYQAIKKLKYLKEGRSLPHFKPVTAPLDPP